MVQALQHHLRRRLEYLVLTQRLGQHNAALPGVIVLIERFVGQALQQQTRTVLAVGRQP